MMPGERLRINKTSNTTRTALELYSQNNCYMRIGDDIESIVSSVDISKLDPANRLTLESSIRLILVTAFQLVECLPDALAVRGVLNRVDWKYALDLPMGHLGITAFDLCRFRQDLFSSKTALKEFGRLLNHFRAVNLFPSNPGLRMNPVDAVITICLVNRNYALHEARKAILNLLITTESEGAVRSIGSCWYDRYKIGPLTPSVYPSIDDLKKENARTRSDIQQLVLLVHNYKNSSVSVHVESLTTDRSLKGGFTVVDDQLQWDLPVCDPSVCVLQLADI